MQDLIIIIIVRKFFKRLGRQQNENMCYT